MRRITLSLAALALVSLVAGTAKAATSYPVAAHVGTTMVSHYGHSGHHGHRSYHHGFRHPYRYHGHSRVIIHPRVIAHPPVYHHYRTHYGYPVHPHYYSSRGGFSYYGRGFGISIGF